MTGPESKPTVDPRHRLLEAAEELFAVKGFDGATVRDICDKAGMNVAAVNYHFGDKERLYVETVKYAHACSIDGTAPPGWPPETPPAEKLRDFIRLMLQQMHGPVRPSALQLVMRELTNPTAAAEELVRGFIQPMAHGLRAIVAELFPKLSARQHLMIGFSIVGQCLYYRQNRRVSEMIFGSAAVAELDLNAVTEHVTKFTLAGLGLGDPYTPTTKRSRS